MAHPGSARQHPQPSRHAAQLPGLGSDHTIAGPHLGQQDLEALAVCGHSIGLHMGGGGMGVRPPTGDAGSHQLHSFVQLGCECPGPGSPLADFCIVGRQEGAPARGVEPDEESVPAAAGGSSVSAAGRLSPRARQSVGWLHAVGSWYLSCQSGLGYLTPYGMQQHQSTSHS